MALGLAVLNVAAAFLYFSGVFPPDDPAASPRGNVPKTDSSDIEEL
jgi:hypothetical protein